MKGMRSVRGGEMVVLSERQHMPSPSARAKTFFSLLNRSSLVRDQHFLYAIKTSPQSRIQPVKKWPYLVSQIAVVNCYLFFVQTVQDIPS